MSDPSYTRSMCYDAYGNGWVTAYSGNTSLPGNAPQEIGGGCPASSPSATPYPNANNQMTGVRYDSNGNQISYGLDVASYDIENRLSALTSSTGTVASYQYDDSGRRISKVVSGVTTNYVYDAMGRLAAEYVGGALSKEYIRTATPYISSSTELIAIENQAGNGSPCATCFVISDDLGNVRLMADSLGTAVSRHDYLPFGEEVVADSNRPAGTGFFGADGASERFTGKERDAESGLDYFGARYYGSALGRFTSADPLLNSGRPDNPQTWNRYAYGSNNPLRNTDPTGLYTCGGDKKQCAGVSDSLKAAKGALSNLKKGSAEYNALNSAINAYGKAGVDNGVHIGFGATSGAASTSVGVLADANGNKITTTDNPTGQNVNVTVDPSKNGSVSQEAIDLAHEGSHVADGTALIGALPMNLAGSDAVLGGPLNMTSYQTEMKAYGVSWCTAQGLGLGSLSVGNGNVIWNSSWGAVDVQALRNQGIQHELADPKGLYNVTPENQGHKLIQ